VRSEGPDLAGYTSLQTAQTCPQHVHRLAGCSCSTAATVPTRLSLTTGGFIIPHPQKVAKGGEDAYYIGERSVGVADGVGGWVCTPPLHGDRPLRPARIKPISALWTPSALFVICAKCMGSVLAGMGPARESGWWNSATCHPMAMNDRRQ